MCSLALAHSASLRSPGFARMTMLTDAAIYEQTLLEGCLRELEAKPVIWIIDSQQWPRAYLRAELIERGFDVVGFVELGEALAAFNDPEYVTPRLIVLELQRQSITKTDLEVLALFGIPAVALGGAAELSEERVKSFKWAALMQRPFTIGKVADVVEEWVSRG